MSFFDNVKKVVKKTTKDVVKVSGDAVEFTKLKFKIADLNDKINDAYIAIGKEMYKSSIGEEIDSEFVEEKCECITQMNIQINPLEQELAVVTNRKACPRCSTKNNTDSTFCSKCGEKFDDESREA